MRHTNRWSLATALLTIPLMAVTFDSHAQPFREGDRACFMGDSITHNGLYHSFIYLFYQTRYPDMRVEFLNCGMSGGRTTDGAARLDEDVLAREPSVVVINLGMNDVGTSQFTDPDPARRDELTATFLERFRENLTDIVDRIRAHDPDIRIILTAPSPYDQTGTQERESAVGKDDAIAAVTRFLGTEAKKHGLEFVDFHTPMAALNRAGQVRDPDFTIVGQDRVHPGPMGHTIMTYLLLKAQGVEATVSEVDLEVGSGGLRLKDAKKAQVSELNAGDGTLEFTVLAECLPYPVEDVARTSGEPTARAALEWVPFQEELNREFLRVAGLTAERYRLAIDGTPVGIYSADELAAGINLAGNTLTPQYQQAEKLAMLNDMRWDLERPLRGPAWVKWKVVWEGGVDPADEAAAAAQIERWREGKAHRDYRDAYDRHYLEFKHPAAYAEREAKIAEVVEQIYAENQPRKLRYTLTPTELKELPAPELGAAAANQGLEAYAPLLEFDDVRPWSGLELDATDPRSGKFSGLWRDTVANDRIRCRTFPADLSTFDTLRVWVHSEAATGAMFAIVFRSEDETTDGPDYEMARIAVNWTGWKQLEVPFRTLTPVRSPRGMGHVSEFLMASSGYGCGDADPETRLKFDRMEFVRLE